MLQKLQDTFANSFNLPSIICELNGEPITQPSNFTVFCHYLKLKTNERYNCLKCSRINAQQLLETNEPIISKNCIFSNILTATVPIIIENQHLANYFITQIAEQAPDIEEMKQFAKKNALNAEKLIELSSTLVIVSTEKIENALKFLEVLVEQLAHQAKQKIKLKALNAEQAEMEKMYRLLADNSSDVVWLIDLDFNFRYISPAIIRLYGYSPDESKTKSLSLLLKEKDIIQLHKIFNESIEEYYNTGDLQTHTLEFESTHKNGHTVYTEVTAKTVLDSEGKVIGIQGTSRDISDRKQYDLELIKAKEKAEEGDRLKSAFLKNISHEIRTPMNAITGFSDLLLKQDLPLKKQIEYKDIMHRSVHQLLEIVDNIITIAHIETKQLVIKKMLFSPDKLIQSLFSTFNFSDKRSSNNEIEFIAHNQNLPNLLINNDYSRIKQILDIFLNNSFKFTRKGKIEFGYTFDEAKKTILFFVKDTGIGIPPDRQEIILKSFAQADDTIRRVFGGVGLGLSIAHGLLKLMGSELKIISGLKTGTEMRFTIHTEPIENDATISLTTHLAPDERNDWKNKTVLVAEDELLNYIYVEELLSTTKISILHAHNGLEAVEMFKESTIDIILMDLKMPKLDGFGALNEIRKINPNIPIIAQTAYSYRRQECISAGFTDYISKPYKEEGLLKILSQYL